MIDNKIVLNFMVHLQKTGRYIQINVHSKFSSAQFLAKRITDKMRSSPQYVSFSFRRFVFYETSVWQSVSCIFSNADSTAHSTKNGKQNPDVFPYIRCFIKTPRERNHFVVFYPIQSISCRLCISNISADHFPNLNSWSVFFSNKIKTSSFLL